MKKSLAFIAFIASLFGGRGFATMTDSEKVVVQNRAKSLYQDIRAKNLRPLNEGHGWINEKRVPFETCEIRIDTMAFGLIGDFLAKNPVPWNGDYGTFLYCYSEKEKAATVFLILASHVQYGFSMFLYQPKDYPRFEPTILDQKGIIDIGGRYQGPTFGFGVGVIPMYSALTQQLRISPLIVNESFIAFGSFSFMAGETQLTISGWSLSLEYGCPGASSMVFDLKETPELIPYIWDSTLPPNLRCNNRYEEMESWKFEFVK